MGTILIKEITKTLSNRVEATLVIDGKYDIIYADASENVCSYLSTDRCDAFVIGLLYSALQKGFDIVSKVPISEELLYNLENHFIDALALPGTGLNKITITAPTIGPCAKKGTMIATGISCGVDSLYTIATHSSSDMPLHKITHLAFYNVGSNDRGQGEEDAQHLFEGRYELCKKFAEEYGYEFYAITSNLNKVISRIIGEYSHVSNHTYVNAFCTMLIQGGVSRYYYSAGYGYELFRCRRLNDHEDFDASHYDLLSLSAFSLSGIRFYSVGAAVLRKDKTAFLAKYKPAHKYLNVCVNTVKNDCTCFKCVRTLLTLDGLGIIEKFSESFDIEYYKSHKIDYLKTLFIDAKIKHDPLMEEIYPMFAKDITLLLKYNAILSKLGKAIIRRLK